MELNEILTYTVNEGCSDLHLCAGEHPIVRYSGDLKRLNDRPELTSKDVEGMLKQIMTPEQFASLHKHTEVDFSYEIPGLARFRINAFSQSRGYSAAFRALSYTVPSFEDVNLTNDIFNKICHYANGLVLITGATGSGKSTTLAAMINNINTTPMKNKHIITVEDPIEYIFRSKECLIQQREIGKDTLFFHTALRAALREDPDILMIGELRDLETIRLALTAAETGHLVFGTLHTSSAPNTIDRIIDVFPGNEKDMIREILAESLRAVIAQRLFKTPEGKVYPGHEILISTTAVRNLIREHKIPQLYSAMQTGTQHGMQTMEQHVKDLIAQNKILPLTETLRE